MDEGRSGSPLLRPESIVDDTPFHAARLANAAKASAFGRVAFDAANSYERQKGDRRASLFRFKTDPLVCRGHSSEGNRAKELWVLTHWRMSKDILA